MRTDEERYGDEINNVAAVSLLMGVGASGWTAHADGGLMAEWTLKDGRVLTLWDMGAATIWRLADNGTEDTDGA